MIIYHSVFTTRSIALIILFLQKLTKDKSLVKVIQAHINFSFTQ